MLEKSQIETLLPHRGAMFLLERVTRFDADEIECIATNHRDPKNPLRDGHCLPVHTAVEYAAQAAGVHGGLLARQLRHDAPVQRGYLAVVSNLSWQVERLDDLPGDLEIHARRTAVTPGGVAYRVETRHQGRSIMSGDLIIALDRAPPDLEPQ
jgi:predicted hotdog family 3-hydroxylacyl-ACP dehydratase